MKSEVFWFYCERRQSHACCLQNLKAWSCKTKYLFLFHLLRNRRIFIGGLDHICRSLFHFSSIKKIFLNKDERFLRGKMIGFNEFDFEIVM